MILQDNTRKTDLTLSAAPEVEPAPSGSPADPRHPGLVDGLAPNTVAARLGATRLCGVCVTLIRQDVRTGAWSHCAVGFDHVPDPDAYSRVRGTLEVPTYTERDRPIVTESELRLLDGNR